MKTSLERGVALLVLVAALMAIGSLSACASNPNRAERIDTRIEYSQDVSGETVIGVKNGDMVVQKKVMMSEELRTLQNESRELEAKVYGGHRYYDNRGLYGVLRDCYNSGSEMRKMPENRNYVIPDDTETQIGIEGNRLVGVTQEYLKDRIERFRAYRKVLMDRKDEYEDKISQCTMKVAAGGK